MVRRVKSLRPEIWTRTITISSFRESIGVHGAHHRGSDPEIESRISLELTGLVDEPVRDTREIEVLVFPEDELRVGTARPVAVGAIIEFRPHLKLVVSFLHRDFDRLCMMALSGHLKFVHVMFTEPQHPR